VKIIYCHGRFSINLPLWTVVYQFTTMDGSLSIYRYGRFSINLLPWTVLCQFTAMDGSLSMYCYERFSIAMRQLLIDRDTTT
jgi:hypothetical protein